MTTYSNRSTSWRIVGTKRKDGTITEQWQCAVSFTEDGKRYRKTKLFPADAKLATDRQRNRAARKWLQELDEAEIERAAAEEEARRKAEEEERKAAEEALASSDPLATKTVAELVSEYVDFKQERRLRMSAVSDYRSISRGIAKSAIGDVLVRDLTPLMVDDWITDSLKVRSVNTTLKYLRLLHGAYQRAVKMNLIDSNPTDLAEPPKREAPKPNSLTPEQFRRVIATLEAMEPSWFPTVALIACFTGARLGEILAMRWNCYDPETKTIIIRENIERAGGQTKAGDTKTDASKRVIHVVRSLAYILERRRLAMVEDLEVHGIVLDEDDFQKLYICGDINGNYTHPTVASRRWRAFAEDYELTGTQGRRVRFHDLRHTWATLTLSAGNVGASDAASVLGHSDASLVLRVYADALKEGKERAMANVEDFVLAEPAQPYDELAAPSD